MKSLIETFRQNSTFRLRLQAERLAAIFSKPQRGLIFLGNPLENDNSLSILL